MKTKQVKTKDDSSGEKVAAKIVIYRGSEMTKRGKKQIANWLRRQAACTLPG